jgi:hypothetical protein
MNNAAIDRPVDLPVTKERKKLSESAAIKLLPKLTEAFLWNQRGRVAEIGEDIAAAIDTHYPAVAKRLRDSVAQELRPRQMAQPTHLISFEDARHGLESVILPEALHSECIAIIQEHHRKDDLYAFGLFPRHKVLLHGKPGNGKTLLAEALAHELQVPFLRVKYGGLLASFLGETGKNIDTLMEYAQTAPCLLFLDEFDGIGMDRSGAGDIGEMRRITNQLLIALDRLPHTCMLVAATNSMSLVDSALKRRFDFVLEVPTPTEELIRRCAANELVPALTPGHDVSCLSERIMLLRLEKLSDVVNLCKRIRRDLVLNGGNGIDSLLSSPVIN